MLEQRQLSIQYETEVQDLTLREQQLQQARREKERKVALENVQLKRKNELTLIQQEQSRNEKLTKETLDMQSHKNQRELELQKRREAREESSKRAYDNLSKFIDPNKRDYTEIQ